MRHDIRSPWWADESTIPPGRVPDILPPRPDGSRVSPCSVRRWASTGVRGLRLRWSAGPRRRCATVEEVRRFPSRRSRSRRAGTCERRHRRPPRVAARRRRRTGRARDRAGLRRRGTLNHGDGRAGRLLLARARADPPRRSTCTRAWRGRRGDRRACTSATAAELDGEPDDAEAPGVGGRETVYTLLPHAVLPSTVHEHARIVRELAVNVAPTPPRSHSRLGRST